MVILAEAKISEVYKELRFDAEYFKPEFIETEKNLERINAPQLESVVKISKLRKDPTKEPNTEFVYIDISNVDTTTGNTIIQTIHGYKAPSRARKLVHSNDIIISTVRPNRNAVAIITNELDNSICSTGFCVLTATKINPYYLFAFLKTKYAINQLIRKTMASMYPAVSEEDIANILVSLPPQPFQLKIENLVKEAFSKRNLADQKYEQAKQILEEVLRLDKLELKEEKTFETKFSRFNEENRFDVEFYNPPYVKIITLLEEGQSKKIFEVKTLSEIGNISKGIEIGSDSYTTDGYLFLRVSNISEEGISIGESSEFIRPYLYEQLKSKYKPKVGEVLYTKDATIGVSLVVEDDNELIPSSGIVRIKPKSIDPYYLALVLNSVICRSQSERYSIGAVIKHFTFTNVKELKVPLIPKPKQEEISNLVKESFKLRKESKSLLDQAKHQVEELIGK